MTKKMIIDATHLKETRVALIDENNQLTDLDFESTTKPTLKGNIYLAKIERVEPSLQAAFIKYGGNRDGFLAFNEIHPDYFRIPVSDREALKAEMQKISLEEPEENPSLISKISEKKFQKVKNDLDNFASSSLQLEDEANSIDMSIDILDGEASNIDEDEGLMKRPHLHKMYKIQEVIHKNQILLVQVVKDERGEKGAALTTFLSMAGRYCVLMPNSPRKGGVSRKISNTEDRTRLKKILEGFSIPEGIGLIIRTAGRERTKAEIKRDAEFLMRAWNTIRDLTLNSIAPSLIYEEDDIIKRAIRDLYAKDVEEILIEGEEGYKIARNFMKTLIPSHVKKIQYYKETNETLFNKFKLEAQIDQMHNAVVQLSSGGSIVIHPTEALVSIDINSGRSTRERHIEETAVKTNLEAADEIARQIRLRDLAGLLVIDFIDMDEPRNIASVERRLREALRTDRARIQIGKIGPFGLLEFSRQRLRPSILETSSYPCVHCHATGYVRSTESISLYMLRVIEEEASSGHAAIFQIHIPLNIAFYILNSKRSHLDKIETRHDVKIIIEGDEDLISPHYRITCLKRRTIDSLQTNNITPSKAFTQSSARLNDNSATSKSNKSEALPSGESIEVENLSTSSSNHYKNRSRHKRPHYRSQKFNSSISQENLISTDIENDSLPKNNFPSPVSNNKSDSSTNHKFSNSLQINSTTLSNVDENESKEVKTEPYNNYRSKRQWNRRPRKKYPVQNTNSSSHDKSQPVLDNSNHPVISDNNFNIPAQSSQNVTESISQDSEIQKKKSKKKWWKKLLE